MWFLWTTESFLIRVTDVKVGQSLVSSLLLWCHQTSYLVVNGSSTLLVVECWIISNFCIYCMQLSFHDSSKDIFGITYFSEHRGGRVKMMRVSSHETIDNLKWQYATSSLFAESAFVCWICRPCCMLEQIGVKSQFVYCSSSNQFGSWFDNLKRDDKVLINNSVKIFAWATVEFVLVRHFSSDGATAR